MEVNQIMGKKEEKFMEEYDNKEKDVLDKVRYRDLFLDYIRYMSKSGDGEDIQKKRDLNKEDIQMHYEKGDEKKDYFEHMDKEDIPKDEI